MQEGNKKVENIFWKIGIGIIIGVLVVLFILFLYSPVRIEFTKTIDGEYFRYKTEDHEEEYDKVVIHIDGEIQREHRLPKGDITFVGDVWVEFEKNPDRNFKMGRDELLFTRLNENTYFYLIGADRYMYDCVDSINWNEGESGCQISMHLREDWETWENWFYQEDMQDELSADGETPIDAVIRASFD